ncbi:MAG: bifunctional pyr operon transcriptional regulator/uracil phosphoribosyltransferase PyrR [Magnetococcales bacterium]|nr:bifunctional pyr operon transcriptional regulator/uracil phosphoribosyltransferase PyrR [Magnetococcales bacterium]MBF0156403.1 bifunctional pyr operon transcriptional regulator/uracil phosphoribosyltransferase PyrR [Magnetococcales bacterium]
MSLPREEILLGSDQTPGIIADMAVRLANDITRPDKRVVVGIRRGGAQLAYLLRQQLTPLLDRELPLGFLDITFYRDDLDTIGPNPVVGGTDLAMNIDDKRIILVDDVLFTGRTIRAALNALFDYGRPEIVDLAVLVDRGHRQLPIQPDYAGVVIETGEREFIKVREGEGGALTVVRRFL